MTSMWMNVSAPGFSAELTNSTCVFRPGRRSLITAPIVNPPQVAILSTDGVRKRPIVIESADGDSIAIRPVGVLAQSFDHRAVDGAYSAGFLRELKRIVETRPWVEDVA